jgi:hypothetical protein
MMKKTIGRSTTALMGAALALGLFAIGCGDDDNVPQQDFGNVSLSLQATSELGEGDAIEIADPDGTVFTMTDAWVVIEQIELDLPDNVDCDSIGNTLDARIECVGDDNLPLVGDEDELEIDGPFVLNLRTGETSPSLADLQIPAIDYDQIDVEVNDLDSDDNVTVTDERIIGNTVLGLADFEFDGQKRELQLEMSFDTEAKTSDSQSINLDDGDTLVLRFDVTNWLNNIPVTQCLRDADLKSQDGRVVVDDDVSGECDDAEGRFESNFEDSVSFSVE